MFKICNCSSPKSLPNCSFEQFTSCPWTTGQVDSAIGWHNVLNTPDYFATCSPYPVSIPDNVCGSKMPFDGSGYMGLYTYAWAFPNNQGREIIGCQLCDTLIPGDTYLVYMSVSRGNWTNQAYNVAASNKLGFRFTTFEHTLSYPPSINNYAQLYVDSIVTDTLNWVLLHWEYVPDSAYTHVYVGNTDTLVINAPLGQFGQAYYFIDSVNITCINKDCTTGSEPTLKEEFSIEFDENSQSLFLHTSEKAELYWLTLRVR